MKKLLGEYEKSKYICIFFPYRKDVWRGNALPAQKMVVELANTIAEYQPVLLGVIPELEDYVKTGFEVNANVQIVPVKYNDSWARDSLSSVICDGESRYVNAFGFNAYGAPLYTPYDDDQKLNTVIYKNVLGYPVNDVPVVLEWGNITPDGNGTLFAVEDSIVNDNRNPEISKQEIEKIILESTGAKQMVWLPYGLDCDETGGHIDNVLAFADASTMLVSYTDDPTNIHYKRTNELFKSLSKCTNANGEPYKLIKLPVPKVHIRNAADSLNICENDDCFPRTEGDSVLYTYVNFVAINGAVVVPKFNIPEDSEAIRIIAEAFPDRKIIALDAHEAFLGGGGFHCLTKHIN